MTRRARRVLLWAGGLVAILAATAAAIVYAGFHVFYPVPPAPAGPPAHDLASAQRQDLAYFRHYFDLDRSYSDAARAKARALWSKAYARAGSLTPPQFDLAILEMVALADNGHSQVFRNPMARGLHRVPCRLYRFSDGYRVLRARPACAALLGGRLDAIDGRPVDAIVDAMFVYAGGPRSHYDQYGSAYFRELPELLHAAGLGARDDAVTWIVTMPDGSTREATLPVDPPDPSSPRVFGDRFLSPQPIPGEPSDWMPYLARDAVLPMFLTDYATPFRTRYLAESRTYYAELKSNDDEDGHAIAPFVEGVTRDIATVRPRTVIIDLRFDQGGNFTKTAGLMKHVATLAPSIEHVYLLTSAWTFSAGDVNIALAREHGRGRVTVVGEGPGDRVRIFAEGGDIVLPNSKLDIGFATGLHDYSKSCFGETGCFWVLYFYPMHVASLAPDVDVSYTFADYAAGRDPVLARVMAMAMASDR
jgi:hypothetical protein